MDYSDGPHGAMMVHSSGEGSRKDVKTEAEVTGTACEKVFTFPC